DFMIGRNEFRLRSFGREEIELLSIKRIVHRHDVRMPVARATQMPEPDAQQERRHLTLCHSFNFKHLPSPLLSDSLFARPREIKQSAAACSLFHVARIRPLAFALRG